MLIGKYSAIREAHPQYANLVLGEALQELPRITET